MYQEEDQYFDWVDIFYLFDFIMTELIRVVFPVSLKRVLSHHPV